MTLRGMGETLEGSILVENMGETPQGPGFTRQVETSMAKVVIMMTWLDLRFNSEADDQHDQAYWSSGEYISSLVEDHSRRIELYGQCTNWRSAKDMEFVAFQMKRYRLLGMLWYWEDQLFSAQVATFDDYKRLIQETWGE